MKVDGVLTDVTSVVLRDAADTFGVRRTDTLAVVVASGTALERVSQGVYEYTFADPAAGLTYNYWVEIVYGGQTYRFEKNQSAAGAADAASYLTLDEADELAAVLPLLAKYKAATSDARGAAMILATMDVDAGGPWQGCRYDRTSAQVLEFPRIPYPSSCASGGSWINAASSVGGAQVWDWDDDASAAVVPLKVKQAVLFQADAILDGRLARALEDQSLGVASKSVGSLSVSYRDPAAIAAALGGGLGTLTQRAAALMRMYRLKQGQLL